MACRCELRRDKKKGKEVEGEKGWTPGEKSGHCSIESFFGFFLLKTRKGERVAGREVSSLGAGVGVAGGR